MKRFEYICCHNTDDGYKIDDFTLFANVLSMSENTVTYKRYQKFGELKHSYPITVPISVFNCYYQPITDEIYDMVMEAANG